MSRKGKLVDGCFTRPYPRVKAALVIIEVGFAWGRAGTSYPAGSGQTVDRFLAIGSLRTAQLNSHQSESVCNSNVCGVT